MYSAGSAVTIELGPDEAWRIVGDFLGFPAWNPMVPATRAEEDGRYRRDLVEDFPDGSLEERVFRSDRARAYSYRSVNLAGGKFAIVSYHGNLKVWPAVGPNRSHVAWINQIVPSAPGDAERCGIVLQRMQDGRKRGLAGLVARFGGEPRELAPHCFSVAVAADLPIPAPAAWAVVGDFHGLRGWHPAAPGIWREQQQRRVPLGQSEALVERELSRDDDRMSYSYHSVPVERSFAFDSHIGNFLGWALSPHLSRVVWSGQFLPADPDDDAESGRIRRAFSDLFQDGLGALAKQHSGVLLPHAVSAGGTALPV